MESKVFKTSCDTLRLKEIRGYVSEHLKPYRMRDSDRNMVILAVDEVCANIMIHSNGLDENKSIELCIHQEEDRLIIEIFDTGKAFNPQNYHEPDLKDVVEQRKKGGIGIMIVRKVMDKIEYSKVENRNVCRLYKQMPAIS